MRRLAESGTGDGNRGLFGNSMNEMKHICDSHVLLQLLLPLPTWPYVGVVFFFHVCFF